MKEFMKQNSHQQHTTKSCKCGMVAKEYRKPTDAFHAKLPDFGVLNFITRDIGAFSFYLIKST